MKTTSAVAVAAFPDRDHEPAEEALVSTLGLAAPLQKEILNQLYSTYPAATLSWQYSPGVGWYRVALQKQRRLFYFVPKPGNFQLSILLGRNAIASLLAGPHQREIGARLKTARRYPEGTSFVFDRQSFDAGIFAVLLAAKLAHYRA